MEKPPIIQELEERFNFEFTEVDETEVDLSTLVSVESLIEILEASEALISSSTRAGKPTGWINYYPGNGYRGHLIFSSNGSEEGDGRPPFFARIEIEYTPWVTPTDISHAEINLPGLWSFQGGVMIDEYPNDWPIVAGMEFFQTAIRKILDKYYRVVVKVSIGGGGNLSVWPPGQTIYETYFPITYYKNGYQYETDL